MILFHRSGDFKDWLEQQRGSGKSIGFVPTMGALHAGHISLITTAEKTSGLTVCSIFVNPTQFNDPKDFQKYPVTLEKDIALLEKAGAGVLFLPAASELYPDGTTGLETYPLGRLETIFEGRYRPGHFQGVCQVMHRLLDIVRPDDLFMGQKDYQQCMVIQRLLELSGFPTRLHRCPIVREPDGLAMSSRNMRLTPEQHANALAIYRALRAIKSGWNQGVTAQRLITEATGILETAAFRVDYVSIADATTLEALPPDATGKDTTAAITSATKTTAGKTTAAKVTAEKTTAKKDTPSPKDTASAKANAVALIAAFQGEVRLIDNMTLE